MQIPATELEINEKRLVRVLQLLGDETRFKMFKLLVSDSELCVSEIAKQLRITPSAVSQHFKNFELLGLVKKERDGQRICYTLQRNDPLLNDLESITSIFV